MATTRSRPRRTQSTTGALPTTPAVESSKNETVAAVIKGAAPVQTPAGSTRQTHGAITGPITNVSQLMNGGRNVAKGSIGSFTTLADYTAHLRTLGLHALHEHAIRDARIVPIDDRERLIKRLETAWTGERARFPGSAAGAAIPKRVPFTQEQMTAQADLLKKALRR